jgi:hypothetical protein
VPVAVFEGGIGIDATVPLMAKDRFLRGRYAVDKVNFEKWFTQEEMKAIRAGQSEYFRFLGKMGYA